MINLIEYQCYYFSNYTQPHKDNKAVYCLLYVQALKGNGNTRTVEVLVTDLFNAFIRARPLYSLNLLLNCVLYICTVCSLEVVVEVYHIIQ